MPHHGLIKLKRFARLEISTSLINVIITEKKSNPVEVGKGFSSNFAFVRIFRKFLGCLVVNCTVLL